MTNCIKETSSESEREFSMNQWVVVEQRENKENDLEGTVVIARVYSMQSQHITTISVTQCRRLSVSCLHVRGQI